MKMTNCKSCGHEISTSAKTCPNCGAKIKKPIYKRVWVYILAFVLIVGIGGCMGSSDSTSTSPSSSSNTQKEETIEYTSCSIKEMQSELDENALAASDKYSGQYISIKGKLDIIDSSGDYFTVCASDDDWGFDSIHCEITSDDQLEAVKSLKSGDIIRVKGRITSVGEVLGYSLDVKEIPKKAN